MRHFRTLITLAVAGSVAGAVLSSALPARAESQVKACRDTSILMGVASAATAPCGLPPVDESLFADFKRCANRLAPDASRTAFQQGFSGFMTAARRFDAQTACRISRDNLQPFLAR